MASRDSSRENPANSWSSAPKKENGEETEMKKLKKNPANNKSTAPKEENGEEMEVKELKDTNEPQADGMPANEGKIATPLPDSFVMGTDSNSKEEIIHTLPDFNVNNIKQIKAGEFLKQQQKIFSRKLKKWNRISKNLSILNISIAILYLGIQAAQVISINLVPEDIAIKIATILPVVSGVLLTIYELLKCSNSAIQSKEAANRYALLLNEITCRQEMFQCGGEPTKKELLRFYQIASECRRKDPCILCFTNESEKENRGTEKEN